MDQVKRYVNAYKDGTNNPDPQIRIVQEGPATAVMTGDGGLGIIVGAQAMALAMEKAREVGLAAVDHSAPQLAAINMSCCHR